MSDRLSMSELAKDINCKPNQRALMIKWLSQNGWKFEIDSKGYPLVAKEYRNRKLGISEGKAQTRYEDSPNRQAFA